MKICNVVPCHSEMRTDEAQGRSFCEAPAFNAKGAADSVFDSTRPRMAGGQLQCRQEIPAKQSAARSDSADGKPCWGAECLVQVAAYTGIRVYCA